MVSTSSSWQTKTKTLESLKSGEKRAAFVAVGAGFVMLALLLILSEFLDEQEDGGKPSREVHSQRQAPLDNAD